MMRQSSAVPQSDVKAGPAEGGRTSVIENRRAVRKAAALVPAITCVRLSPVGGEAVLVNISATGVLVRCMTRVRPDTAVNVVFEGGFSPAIVQSRIVRSVVAQIDAAGRLWFDLGIAFNKAIPFGEATETRNEKSSTPLEPRPSTNAPQPVMNRW